MKANVFFLFLLFSSALSGQQAWQWGYEAGGPGNDFINSISTSPAGSSYVTGRFYATATFGSQSVTTYGYPDIFIAKYSSGGVCLWARHAGSSDLSDLNGDDGTGIDIDAAENCYVTGNFYGEAVFGTDTIGSSSTTTRNIFLAKYDSNGNELWVRCPVNSGNFYNYSRSVSVDSAGNAWITGYLGGGSNTFGAFTLNGAGGYVVKYDPNGNVVFATKLGVNGAFDLYGVTNDRAGNSYVAGYLQGAEILASQNFTSTAFRDPVLIKVDTSGNYAWLRRGVLACNNTAAWGNGYSVCCDTQDNVYCCGRVEADVAFGNDTVFVVPQATIQIETFLVKYDPNGNELWATQSVKGAASGYAIGRCITADQNSNIYMTGGFSVDVMFGSQPMNNNNTGLNTYIAMFEPVAGVCQFTITSTGQNPGAYANGISVDAHGGAYIGGLDKGPVTFGNFQTNYIGSEDVFIAKISSDNEDGVNAIVNDTHASLWGIPGAFHLSVNDAEVLTQDLHFVLYDVSGRIVKTVQVNSSETDISRESIAPGIYYWQLTNAAERLASGKISAF